MKPSRDFESSKTESIFRWLEEVESSRHTSRRDSPSCLDANGAKRRRTKKRHTNSSPTHQQPSKQIPKNQQAPRLSRKKMDSPEKAKVRGRKGLPTRQMPNRQVKRTAAQHVQFDERVSPQAASNKRKQAQEPSIPEREYSVLSDPSPSAKTSKTSTSARVRLRRLSFARPPVICKPFGVAGTPNVVTELFHDLLKSKKTPVPAWIVDRLEKEYPTDAFFLKSDNTDRVASAPSLQDKECFNVLVQAYDKARESYLKAEDENGWSDPIHSILGTVVGRKRDSMLGISAVQSVSIGPASLLPSVDHHATFKKVDYLISYQCTHDEIHEVTAAVLANRQDLLLSQTEDTHGTESHFVAVEIKSPDGSLYSSILQLATWLAAGLEKRRQLQTLVSQSTEQPPPEMENLPVLGISVVGHTWYLFIAVNAQSGGMTLYGPIGMGDTLSFEGVFQIFSMLQQIKIWGQEVYWPWLRDTILRPLAKPLVGELP
ncbi:hypothetical protein FQN49_004760 [Arthroderma sp. PD_2]|nr:hypothetical protein FQN49_004760 [Arthroderma sp. PD_2]